MASSGAQLGNNNAGKGRDWADAVRKVLAEVDPKDKRKRLIKIASKLVELAEEGDMQAIKEIGDRLDGKAAQSVQVDGELAVEITKIERTIVHPTDTDS